MKDDNLKMGDEIIVKVSGERGIYYNDDPIDKQYVWALYDNWQTPQKIPKVSFEKTGKHYPELRNMLDQLNNPSLVDLMKNFMESFKTNKNKENLVL